MKTILPRMYADYLRYIDRYRAMPFYIDVLKPVERRLLISLYQIARNKFVKSAKVVGHCIGNYHPHGDGPTYESLVNLVHRGFVDPQGNFGNTLGLIDKAPAAMRYTEVKLNDYVRFLFEETLPFVKYIEGEIDQDEPLYLSAPVPIGLIGINKIIVGISARTTTIPTYTFVDLCKRLIHLLENKDPKDCIIKPSFTNCDLIEVNGDDFYKILTEGKGTICIKPVMNVTSDYIEILGKCPIGGFSSLISNAETLDIAVIDNSKNSTGTRIIVEYNKRKKIDSDLVQQVEKLVSYNVNFIVNVVDENGIVETVGIDQILLNNFNCWKQDHTRRLEDEIEKIKQTIFEIEVIEIIRAIINNNPTIKSVDKIVEIYEKSPELQKDSVSSSDIRSICSKKSIKSLIEYEYDKNKYISLLKDKQNEISNIDSILYKRILQVTK